MDRNHPYFAQNPQNLSREYCISCEILSLWTQKFKPCPTAWGGRSRYHSLLNSNKKVVSSCQTKVPEPTMLYSVGWGGSLLLPAASVPLLTNHMPSYRKERGGLTLEVRNANIFCTAGERLRPECRECDVLKCV